MKKGFRGLTLFAILLGTVLAETNAGATTLSAEREGTGAGCDTARGIGLPVDGLRDSLGYDIFDTPPPMLLLGASLVWTGLPVPTDAILGTFGAPNEADPVYKLPVGAAALAHKGAAPAPGEMNYGAKGPALQSTDFLSWKSTGDTPPANPEDWLFRLQYTKASSYQTPDPTPFFPIPEPATSVIVLMGVAGLMVRRWRA